MIQLQVTVQKIKGIICLVLVFSPNIYVKISENEHRLAIALTLKVQSNTKCEWKSTFLLALKFKLKLLVHKIWQHKILAKFILA